MEQLQITRFYHNLVVAVVSEANVESLMNVRFIFFKVLPLNFT